MEFREITERYRLEKIIKSGRSGTVLRAADTQSGRTVAVKLIPVGSPAGLEARMAAFQRLANALSTLGHPALPAVLDSGFTPDGNAFLVLELLAGRGLDTLAGSPPTRVLPLLVQVTSGLEALAGQGVAYLNLSPDNVLIVPSPNGDPAGDQAKLLGLGTALFRPLPLPTPPDAAAGDEARRFRAPETVNPVPGERIDSRADLYSLAFTACQVLGATVAAGAPEPVVQMPLALSFELDHAEALRQTLERCLRRRAAERPSPAAVRYALQLAMDGAEPSIWQAAAEALAPESDLEPASGPPPAPPPRPQPVAPPPPAPVAPPEPLPAVPLSPAPPFAGPPALQSAAEPADTAPDEVLSVVDDDVLDALVAAPLPPPAAPPAAAKPAPADAGRVLPFLRRSKPAPPAPAGAAGEIPAPAPAPSRRPLILGVLALFLLVAAGLVLWTLLRQEEPASVPAPAPIAAAAPRPPRKPAAARLEEARLLLALKEDDQAREILRAFTPADEAALPPASCTVLTSLRETLAMTARDRLPDDLTAGLETGNLARLRTAVDTGTEQPDLLAELPAETKGDFDRARQLVDLYAQAATAAQARQHPAVLERFATIATLSPKLVDPLELRKKSAEAVENAAEELVVEGRYPEALAALAPLQSTWPDRLGLESRISSYQAYQKDEAAQLRILDNIPGAERRRKPDEGLEAIDKVKPTPHLAPRFAEARRRLEEQLTQLDSQPPQVVLRDGYSLTYSRGAVATLSFRATDDYQVKSIKLYVRPPGGKMREMPLEKAGLGYTVEIPPSLHQNGTVGFYVVATDSSGHEGALGSRDKPLQLTREQGFQRIVR